MRSNSYLTGLIALLAACGSLAPHAGAGPLNSARTLPPADAAAAPVAGKPALVVKSQLPSPAGADVWVDLVGLDPAGVAAPVVVGRPPGLVRRYAVLVFRPQGDALKWDDYVSLYVAQGVLPGSPIPILNYSQNPGGPTLISKSGLNVKESRVYKPRVGGDALVLGLIRNLRTRNQLAFAVLLSGTLDSIQAALYADGLADSLAEGARKLRMRPPVPQGSVPVMPERRLTTVAQLRELQQSIVRSIGVSARVKQMAQAVMPGATSVTLSAWRTPAPLPDSGFVEFYTREASRLGWGPPVAQDETQPGYPSLLFQRPTGDGVMMIRAQPTPGAPAPQTTTIFVLMMEGRFSK